MIDEKQVQEVAAILGLEATEQIKAKVRTLIQELRPVPLVPFVPAPVVKNNADLAIERQQAKLAAAPQAEPTAPPTNAQRAARMAHSAGISALAPILTELLDRIETLEVRQTGHDNFVGQLVQQRDALAARVTKLESRKS
jgi:hypothetical protein